MEDTNVRQSDLKRIPEAAAQLGVSERTVRRWVKAGKLPTVDIGGQLFIQAAAFDTLKDTQDTTGKSDNASANIVQMPDNVSALRDRIEETLRDTIKRQEGEILHLRQDVTAKQATIDNLTRMLPAPKNATNRNLIPWIIAGALALVAAIGAGLWYYGF